MGTSTARNRSEDARLSLFRRMTCIVRGHSSPDGDVEGPMENNILDSIDPKELGRRLQQARKKRGLTQEAAAQLVALARTTLVAIEKGERRVKAGELISLARVYGQQIGDFVRPRPQVEAFAVQ